MSSISSSNITSAFIDLATFDELEKNMYGGTDATVYFVRDTKRSTWFSQVPVVLSRSSGTADFGQDWSVSISRAGDYLLQTWLRVTLPDVTLVSLGSYAPTSASGTAISPTNIRLRWTRNLMHNLIKEANITFNDLAAAKFDNFHLDFWSAFTTPGGKITGYKNMIGDVAPLTGTSSGSATTTIRGGTLNLPLPFFFSRDSGVALPTAALPYNEMRLNFSFRSWNELLIVDDVAALTGKPFSRPATTADLTTTPSIGSGAVQVWANYAIVSNSERQRMGCAPRDILIEQAQLAPATTFVPSQNSQPSIDLRFSHAIKALFFSVRNRTNPAEWSNYTTASPAYDSSTLLLSPTGSFDPILNVSLVYENTQRLSQMGSDYFSLVNPWYTAPSIPVTTGYHMYSYTLSLINPDPMGSTNYGKLTNVSIVPTATPEAIAANNTTGATFRVGATDAEKRKSGVDYQQLYEFRLTAINNNIVRVSGGALGFPVL